MIIFVAYTYIFFNYLLIFIWNIMRVKDKSPMVDSIPKCLSSKRCTKAKTRSQKFLIQPWHGCSGTQVLELSPVRSHVFETQVFLQHLQEPDTERATETRNSWNCLMWDDSPKQCKFYTKRLLQYLKFHILLWNAGISAPCLFNFSFSGRLSPWL